MSWPSRADDGSARSHVEPLPAAVASACAPVRSSTACSGDAPDHCVIDYAVHATARRSWIAQDCRHDDPRAQSRASRTSAAPCAATRARVTPQSQRHRSARRTRPRYDAHRSRWRRDRSRRAGSRARRYPQHRGRREQASRSARHYADCRQGMAREPRTTIAATSATITCLPRRLRPRLPASAGSSRHVAEPDVSTTRRRRHEHASSIAAARTLRRNDRAFCGTGATSNPCARARASTTLPQPRRRRTPRLVHTVRTARRRSPPRAHNRGDRAFAAATRDDRPRATTSLRGRSLERRHSWRRRCGSRPGASRPGPREMRDRCGGCHVAVIYRAAIVATSLAAVIWDASHRSTPSSIRGGARAEATAAGNSATCERALPSSARDGHDIPRRCEVPQRNSPSLPQRRESEPTARRRRNARATQQRSNYASLSSSAMIRWLASVSALSARSRSTRMASSFCSRASS